MNPLVGVFGFIMRTWMPCAVVRLSEMRSPVVQRSAGICEELVAFGESREKMLDLSLTVVLAEVLANPVLLLVLVLSMGMLVMNGAHDASNAIATCVATRSMTPGKALAMAAIFNFLGVALATFISAAVAETMLNMVNFSGGDRAALVALAAAMVAVISWGGITWYLGIPTSQSHALIAGITGAAIALQNGIGGINFSEWSKVLWGLLVAALLGFLLGWSGSKAIGKLCRWMDHRRTSVVFEKLQIVTSASLAFLHGAQDGQKFMSICMLGLSLSLGHGAEVGGNFPLWIMLLSSLCMCGGTAVGGKKIIKSVGMKIVKLEKWEGCVASFAASICILLSNLTGLPISTSHTNTTAIMGVGSAKQIKAVNWGLAKDMLQAWIYTFPGCGVIGFILAKLFIQLV
jgi:PiT family inorganic phosphate transporter